jgi:hypothetical protein
MPKDIVLDGGGNPTYEQKRTATIRRHTMTTTPPSDSEGTPLDPLDPLELGAHNSSAVPLLTTVARSGATATALLSALLLLIMTYTLKSFITPTAPLLTWASFALHPFLMTLAFGVSLE